MNNYKTLIIVESPAKCKKIETYLGKELYKCVASYGHIRELDIKKGINCIQKDKNYEPIFKIMTRQTKRISDIRKDMNKYKEVILATDDDREGEAIAWHICQVLKLPIKTTKRIIFHEITQSALIKAVQNPTYINMNTVQSQKARQVLDLLVGFSVSPMLWKQISSHNKSSLSAGRCQTPALRLVYENELDITNSPGRECYDIRGLFSIPIHKNREKEIKKIEYKLVGSIDTKDDIEEFLENSVNFEHIIQNGNEKETFMKSPEPLTTSKLQQKASNILNFSPKMTMSSAQKLYEAGYITYMRTDSKLYSEEFINSTRKYIIEKYDETYIKKDINSISLQKNGENKKDNETSTPHEAIRPTNINTFNINIKETNNSKTIGIYEIKLYNLIWNNALESCMSDALLLKYSSYITAPLERKYLKTFEKIIFKGWLIVQGKYAFDEQYEEIKLIKKGTKTQYKIIKAEFSLKDLKQHYTEAKLVSLLEKKGIGRPSTFSSLITKIIDRGYVLVQDVDGKKIKGTDYELIGSNITKKTIDKICGSEKKKLVLQPIGRIVIEFLIKNYNDIFNYEYTDIMEKELDIIDKGEIEWYKICKKYDEELCSINNKVNETSNKIEYVIDDFHKYKIGRYGGYIERTIQLQDNKPKKERLKLRKGIEFKDIEELVKTNSEIGKKFNIDDIIDIKINPLLGKYNDKDVLLKNGKYGLYITYDGKNTSIKNIGKEHIDIKLNDVIPYINNKQANNTNIIRHFNENCSLRKGKGKSGNYIFYKTNDMKKPIFINIKKYKGDIENDDASKIIEWIKMNV